MKKIVTAVALTILAASAFAQNSTPTPQSPADAQKEKVAVAKEAKQSHAGKKTSKTTAKTEGHSALTK